MKLVHRVPYPRVDDRESTESAAGTTSDILEVDVRRGQEFCTRLVAFCYNQYDSTRLAGTCSSLCCREPLPGYYHSTKRNRVVCVTKYAIVTARSNIGMRGTRIARANRGTLYVIKRAIVGRLITVSSRNNEYGR